MAISREWAFTKDFVRKVYNREVNEYFRDVDDSQLPDNTTSRKAAKRSCLILADTSQNLALIKMVNFFFNLQKAHHKPEIYGFPTEQYQEDVSFRPHIFLYFKQDDEAVPDGYRAIRGQISFRLINETSNTITRSELTTIAQKIKTEFGTNNGYIWKRGKLKRVCRDATNGINLSILTISESEGTEVIRKIYEVANQTYDDDKCTTVTPERNSVNTSTTKTILGKQTKTLRWRSTANLRFQYAEAIVHGLRGSIVLYDRTKRKPDVLIE